MLMAAKLALQVVVEKNDMAEHEVAIQYLWNQLAATVVRPKDYTAVTAEVELPEGVGTAKILINIILKLSVIQIEERVYQD